MGLKGDGATHSVSYSYVPAAVVMVVLGAMHPDGKRHVIAVRAPRAKSFASGQIGNAVLPCLHCALHVVAAVAG